MSKWLIFPNLVTYSKLRTPQYSSWRLVLDKYVYLVEINQMFRQYSGKVNLFYLMLQYMAWIRFCCQVPEHHLGVITSKDKLQRRLKSNCLYSAAVYLKWCFACAIAFNNRVAITRINNSVYICS